MRTVGSVLKNARIKKGLSLSQVEENTKIKVAVLEKIESDEITQFGSFGHAAGLVKNYGEFLGLDTNYLSAILRRQVGFSKNSKPPSLKLPKFLVQVRTQVLAFLVLVLVFAYLAFQLATLGTGPKLEVLQPAQGTVVKIDKIAISGITDPEAQVTVNDQKVPTNLFGEFSVQFELRPGVNLIEIVAKKGTGSQRKIVRTVELAN